MYLTDEDMLIYVLDLPEPGQALIEDAKTGKLNCVAIEHLEGWREVIPNA